MDYTMAPTGEPVKHSPPPPSAKRPRGILKNSFQKSPPVSPTSGEAAMSDKELTILNTQVNAGHRRSSSSASHPRRQSSRTPSYSGDAADEENSQRLKWDEANLYLTEQERTSTMKIDEPKTPYAKHYDPSEDPSDDEYISTDDLTKTKVDNKEEDIPGLSLGEPEEAVPESEFSSIKRSNTGRVHVDDSSSGHDDDELSGLSAEDREKHRRFEEMRKKHYEMKNVAKLLGHPEIIDQEDEDGDVPVPVPVPAMPFNGLAK